MVQDAAPSDAKSATWDAKMTGVLKEVKQHQERRNCYVNLTWTHPIGNSTLQENISYAKVSNMVADMYLDTSKLAAPSESTAATKESASDEEGEVQPSILETMSGKRRIWKIPAVVEMGLRDSYLHHRHRGHPRVWTV